MAEVSAEEKTEPASGKKKDDARRKGKVSKSVEMNSAFVLIFGLMILYVGGAAITANVAGVARNIFANAAHIQITPGNVHSMLSQGILSLGLTMGPIVVGLMIVGLAVNYVQVGFLFTLEPLEVKWDRLNPFAGIKNIVGSRRSLMELVKNFIKVCIVGFIAYLSVNGVLEDSLSLVDSDLGAIVGFMASASLSVGLKVGLAYLVLAVMDYFFQKYEYERDLKMTKEEVKEEGKMLEGNPQIKGRIKRIQREIAYKRMMHDVPKADVVVTNPTHVAVALKYDSLKMSAPKVIAKGADLIAQRIKQVAVENNVPIMEDKMLARALYKSVEVGESVPEKLFQAVAQVLAYIYRMKRVKKGFSTN